MQSFFSDGVKNDLHFIIIQQLEYESLSKAFIVANTSSTLPL